MKLLRSNLWIFLLAFGLIFTSCSKDDDEPTNQTSTNVTPETPGDADAVLAAIKVKSNTPGGTPVPGLGDILIDVASANFFSSAGGGSLTKAGDVMINDFSLQTAGNSYINKPTDITLSLNPGQGNDWSVSGGNGFDAFNYSTNKKMPDVIRFNNVPDAISITSSVNLAIQGIPANCDNIIWVISDGNNVVTKTTKATNVTFSESDLSDIRSTSTGIVQVAAYTTESQSFGGKKVYFINETLDTKFVEITN
ncbi:hypothetical protein [Algoriphagus machipongonensis]|uniref:Lipoprotein n=1 Tax=Algoriphagus machipongonensis TaxID=388413 RepID=A3HS80_9BACT|nr:hypothetical protein [Algoriphagus machipongonensis]EAZ82698.1 hypothetical protein ALPR1_10795 [Algoriphagus machipongonensis]